MRHRVWGLGKHTQILRALLLLGFSLPAHPCAKAPMCIMVDRMMEPKTIVSITATSVVSETCTSSLWIERGIERHVGGNTICLSHCSSFYASTELEGRRVPAVQGFARMREQEEQDSSEVVPVLYSFFAETLLDQMTMCSAL